MIKIVKAELNDNIVSQLIELSKIWADEGVSFGLVPNTKDNLKEPCFIALDDKKVVGYVFGHFYETEKKTSYAEIGEKCFDIDEIYVLKEYRNKGIGRKLFQRIEEEVNNSAKFITLVTSTKDYKKIMKFYDQDNKMTFHDAFFFKKCGK